MFIECVICYEYLQSSDVIYHTPCGHVFHHVCLMQWLTRSKTCPQCRENVAKKKISRLYLEFDSKKPAYDDNFISCLRNENKSLSQQLVTTEFKIVESNSKISNLSALLNSKEREIIQLQTSICNAQEDSKVWMKQMKVHRNEIKALERDIVKERNDLMSSNHSWEKVSQMFDGVTDRNILIDRILVTKSELKMATSNLWELKRTVKKLEQDLEEVSEARMFFELDRTKRWELESNLACLEIEKVSLERRIEELEDMVASGAKPVNFMRLKTLREIAEDAYNLVPSKKRKVDKTD